MYAILYFVNKIVNELSGNVVCGMVALLARTQVIWCDVGEASPGQPGATGEQGEEGRGGVRVGGVMSGKHRLESPVLGAAGEQGEEGGGEARVGGVMKGL